MGRVMCFFDEEDGQWAACIDKFEGDCSSCERNPFPGKIIPVDRVLRRKRIQFEYELMTDEEYAEMMGGRDQSERIPGICNRHLIYRRLNRHNTRIFHYRHNVRR
jgi:hypothetical protein